MEALTSALARVCLQTAAFAHRSVKKCMHALHDNDVARCVAGYLEWQTCRDGSLHTFDTVEGLRRLRIGCGMTLRTAATYSMFCGNLIMHVTKPMPCRRPLGVPVRRPYVVHMVEHRFQEHVLAHVKDGQDWCIPKFFNMRKYEDAIPLVGDVEQLSSAPGERTNAEFKSHGGFTNRHASMRQQVMA